MFENDKPIFRVEAFLNSAGLARRIVQIAPRQAFFSQGDPADSVFYLQRGRDEMARVMHEEHAFSDLFLKFLLERSIRIQADLVDQLFNSSEKRLARILLLMAEFSKEGEPAQFLPKISQETLAEMIGTTRSRVSFFMNRFRKMGFIQYNGRIQVHKSLLNVVLHDRMPGDEARSPDINDV